MSCCGSSCGGIIDRYARDRRDARSGFFAARGEFFLPVPAAGGGQWIASRLLFGVLHPWLFDTLYSRFTREMTVERNAFACAAGLYPGVGWRLRRRR